MGVKALPDAAKVNAKVDASWTGKIHGFAQKTPKDTWHPDASYAKALEYAKDPDVVAVHLNRTIDSVLGAKGVSKSRPDVTVIYNDGRSIRTCECVSASQTVQSQNRKNLINEKKLSEFGKNPTSETIQRGGANDPLVGTGTGDVPEKTPGF